MVQRSFARRRGTPTRLVPPALLFLLVQSTGCSGDGDAEGGRAVDAAATLAREFPDQAPVVLGAGRGFAAGAGSFAAKPLAVMKEAVAVELPGDGTGAIVFRAAGGFEARATEIGAAGAGRILDHAVAYARPGGASFWTTTRGGVEEWLHVAAGSSGGGSPVASWQITGAEVRAHGAVVDLVDAAGVVRVRVTAPVAFAPGGRRVATRLGASASTIEVFADAGGEALLVDPVWRAAAAMSAPRYDHRSGVVGSGKVLASGGTDGNTSSLDTASLYDPTADAWADVGPMMNPHVCHTATALADGTVLVVGGLDGNGNPENQVETYGETPGFANVGFMGWYRMNHAAAILTGGKVLVTGGIGSQVDEGVAPVHGGQPAPAILGSGSVTCWTYGVGGCGGPGATSTAEI